MAEVFSPLDKSLSLSVTTTSAEVTTLDWKEKLRRNSPPSER